jgi:YbbR domain-containing protein
MPDRLFRNWPFKLVALVLAFAIWVAVTGESRIVKDFPVPLEIVLSDARILASAPPNNVTVRLRGPEGLLRRLESTSMAMRVDLGDAPPGTHDVQLSKADLQNVPRDVTVEFIDPDRLSLALGRRLRRELKVVPAFLGQPPEGFAFYGAQVLPEIIVVEGPESEIKSLELLKTNPIRLDQRTAPFQVRVSAVAEGTYVRVVDPRPLEVRVEVDAAPVERMFAAIPVQLTGERYRSTPTPEALNVTLSGPPAIVDGMRPESIRLLADVSALEPSGQRQLVEVHVEFLDIPPRDLTRITAKSISRREIAVLVSNRRVTE